ncbi:hypothetical protein VTO42DRAFT_1120 [Malbranchea cinnamomea]
MPLAFLVNALRGYDNDARGAYEANNDKLLRRFQYVLYHTWHLGVTSFGGPPVHFGIFYKKFVEGIGGRIPWIDEQTYQELFAVCQALPGPASTKMLFCIAFIHAGFLPAVLVFLLWSMPGAVGMYGLSLGIQRLEEVLPDIVYAFLSGLNASTVGVIALAAVQLAEKSIKDSLTRILVIMGACAGLCYNALWYFPVLIVIGGCTTATWDCFARQKLARMKRKFRRRQSNPQRMIEENPQPRAVRLEEQPQCKRGVQRRAVASRSDQTQEDPTSLPRQGASVGSQEPSQVATPAMDTRSHSIPVKWGVSIVAGFFASFIVILVVRGTQDDPPLVYDLFTNMYLAGTIIFGGGPVVIPLLREYVVEPGWVSSRDFLIGLAIIQAFPGPNFNFAVFLGALAVASTQFPTILGVFVGFMGIFFPGITLALGFQSVWRVLRKYPITTSALRGMNSTAVGLVFTAVYRLWEIGYLSSSSIAGQSLGKEPFWLVVAAVTYAGNAWFKVPPPVSILFGGILGLCWYGAVSR